jgi:ketosteroid isomerase-like protein
MVRRIEMTTRPSALRTDRSLKQTKGDFYCFVLRNCSIISTASGGDNMSDTNLEIVKKIYELGGKGDFAAFMALLDPSIVIYEADSMPYGGEHRGLAGVGALFQKLNEFVERFHAKPLQFFVSGADVAALIRVTGKARATGESIDMQVMEVWTLENGRATSIRPFYWDTAEFARLTRNPAKS